MVIPDLRVSFPQRGLLVAINVSTIPDDRSHRHLVGERESSEESGAGGDGLF